MNYATKEDVLAIEVKMAEMETRLVREITAQGWRFVGLLVVFAGVIVAAIKYL